MRFINGYAEFSEFEQRRFGLEPTVVAEGDQSFLFYRAVRAALELQMNNNIVLERAGVAPMNEPAHLQHAAHAIGFLTAMAQQRDAYLDAMMQDRPAYVADMPG